MASCPNKTSPEWKALNKALGSNNAMKLFIANGDMIVSPQAGAFQLFTEVSPTDASAILNANINSNAKKKISIVTSIGELINQADPKIFKEPRFLSWSARNKFKIPGVTKNTPISNPQLEIEDLTPEINMLDAIKNAAAIQNTGRTDEILFKMATKLANQTGIDFEMLDVDSAFKILEGSKTPYNNQAGFFYNGIAYFVRGRATLGTVFHEFSHPVVASIRINNRALFDNLYSKVMNTQEGIELAANIKTELEGLSEDSDRFKEELIVRALEQDAINNRRLKQFIPVATPQFISVIKDILYAIKQFLRKIFGKIKVDKLTSGTTINELAEMLANDDFKINTIEITDDEIAMFAAADARAAEDLTNQINNTKSKDVLQRMINAFSVIIKKNEASISHLYIKTSPEETRGFGYKDIKEVLGTKEGGPLREMRLRSRKASDLNLNEAERKAHENLTIAQQATSLISTLATLKVTAENIAKDLTRILNEDVSKLTDTQLSEYTKISILQANAYADMLTDWRGMLDHFESDMKAAEIPVDSSVRAFMGSIDYFLKDGLDTFKLIQRNGAINLTSEWLKHYTEATNKKFKDRINELEEKLKLFPDNATIINELELTKEDQVKFGYDKEKIAAFYRGEVPDASFFSSMFESYVNNADPIVGGFALFIKNAISKVQETAVDKNITFRKDISNLLKELGINPGVNVKETWAFALTQDETYGYEEGELVARNVTSFISPVISGRFKIKELEKKIEAAKTQVKIAKGKGIVSEIQSTEALLRIAVKTLVDEKKNFWWQEYKKEVYEAESSLLDVTAVIEGKVVNVGLEAYLDKREKLSAIGGETDLLFSEIEIFANKAAVQEKWDQYFQLFSLKDENGEDKTGLALLKAEALIAHRDATNKYKKWIDRKGAFATSLKAYEEELLLEEPDLDDAARRIKVRDWVLQNTRAGVTEEYKMELADVFDRLKRFNESLPPGLREELDLSENLNKVSSLSISYKDPYGQPDGREMPADKMEELNDAQQDLNDAMFKISESSVTKLTPEQIKEKAEIFEDLVRLRGKFPTQYYLDIINKQLRRIGEPALTHDDADDFLRRRGDEGVIQAEEAMDKSINFKKWFLANHVKKFYRDKETGQKIYSYERLKVWTNVEPKADEYKEKVEVTYLNGDTEMIMGRTPDFKYKVKVVKNEFRTIPWGITTEEKEKLVGTIIDNKGNYLPKDKAAYNADPAKDSSGAIITSPYINEDYYNLAATSPKHIELLDKIKKYHLANQKGIDYKSRLYLDLPRYRLGNLRFDTAEQIESGRFFSEKIASAVAITKGAVATIKGATKSEANKLSEETGDYEAGLAAPILEEEPTDLSTTEILKNITTSTNDRLPIEGTSYIKPEDISNNVLLVLDKYMLSAVKQTVFTEINPLAKAILETLSPETQIKQNGLDKAAQNASLASNLKHDSKEESKVRLAAIKTLYEREFKGKIFSENHLDWLNKVTSKLMNAASFNYFALNLPSAIKNYWGALWQMNMEAIAGEHMDISSYGKAKVWTELAKMDWINNIYGGDYFTLSNQMIMFFDPLQGKMEEIFGEHGTRTGKSDILSLSWMYSPRKFMEFEAGLQLFAGMMFHKMIEHNIDGKVVEMSYMDSFEIDEATGKMKLKDSVIDKEYAVGGEKYLNFKNLVHEKAKDLNGAFAKFEQPQAQAHFAYRLVMFMRRYFTTMFMNRFAKKRASFITNEVKTGFYIESVKTIGKIIGSYGFYVNLMSDSEKIALKKMASEAAQILIVSAIVALIFGYDDDDPERFAKMENRSGAIGSENFNLPGFLGNHLLLLFLKTSNENQTFLPLPGFGLNDYSRMATVTSIAFGPTLTSYGKIITDIAMHAAPGENAHLYYQREVGPYPWQKAESAKVWNHILAMAGITGSDVDPIKAARSYEAVQKIK